MNKSLLRLSILLLPGVLCAQNTLLQVQPAILPNAGLGTAGQAAIEGLKSPVSADKITPLSLPSSALTEPAQQVLPNLPGGTLKEQVLAAPQSADIAPASAVKAKGRTRKTAVPLSKKTSARRLKDVDFAAFSPEKLKETPAGQAQELGSALMDKVLNTQSAPSVADAVDVQAVKKTAKPKAPKTHLAPKVSILHKHTAHAPGEHSNNRLVTFGFDPEEFALRYLLGKDDPAPKGYELLIGLSVHETMEAAYTWVKNGIPGKDITLEDLLREYDLAWERNLKESNYQPRDGWKPEEYKRRGESFIRRRFELLAPFDKQGEILALEETIHWSMKDPATGKDYPFIGIIDRLMLEGDTIVIHDWKTHFNPPDIHHLKEGDFQLGLYALGLMRSRPDLVKGRKIKLVWDFKEFSQEILVDDAYLARVEAKVFDVLRRIESFSERVNAEKEEWLKRSSPAKDPEGMADARKTADFLGDLDEKIDALSEKLHAAKKEYEELETGMIRFALDNELSEIPGEKRSLLIKEQVSRVPTLTDDPEAHAALVAALKAAGLWELYSTLAPAPVRAMAELRGGEDHAVFNIIQPALQTGFSNEIQTSPKEDAPIDPARGGGVARRSPARKEADENTLPGMLSPTQLSIFMESPDAWVKQYLLHMKSKSPMTLDVYAGSAIHETLEQLFIWIKGGRLVSNIKVEDLVQFFEERWQDTLKNTPYTLEKGVSVEDYHQRAVDYLHSMWKRYNPFDQGRVIYLERRMHYDLTDPETKRVYRFQGIPDRVMIEGDVVVIHDWKSHFIPPSDEEMRAHDYQLGLYVLALRQLFPDLMKGRKARLVWDFKDKTTVIDVDDAYLADLQTRLFKSLRELDAVRTDFDKDRAPWEERLKPVELPLDMDQAGENVGRMETLDENISTLEKMLKGLKETRANAESALSDFARNNGLTRIQGERTEARLMKRGSFSVPTKKPAKKTDPELADPEQEGIPTPYEQIVDVLKAAGVWEKYSQLDYAAIKRALDESKEDFDPELIEAAGPLLKEKVKVSAKLSK
ncbi:MAG: PD-(D/E)XK nuclease family protein [Elusimicrobiota bacterium]